MARNKVSFLFPFLSLLLFLVLSFLRCADSDVARNPMLPETGETAEINVQAPGIPSSLQDSHLLKTRPNELLTEKDVSIVASRLDRRTLKEDLTIKILNPKVYIFDFGPDGQTFRRPCRIEISLEKANISRAELRKLRVYYLRDNSHVDVPHMYHKKSGKMVFWVKHFSRYALSRE